MTSARAAKITLMAISESISELTIPFDELFFQPIEKSFDSLSHHRKCPQLDDRSWLYMGVQRVVDEPGSGRGFLQTNALRFPAAPSARNYFYSLCSGRRVQLLAELNDKILQAYADCVDDRLAGIPELNNYEIFAIDGHWHTGATHDPKAEEKKVSTGHFYSLDLRRHLLRNLAVNEYPKEHDMHVLKRLQPKGLRQGVARGKRVLNVYDRAGIDFDYWRRCKKECAVYFLSRVKDKMVFERLYEMEWDTKDPRNAGVRNDERVHTTNNINLRIITYIEPESGKEFEFLTNLMDLLPGVLVELYRRRWEIEKVYDDLKNKLQQKKSWSSDLTAKRCQGQLIALTYNLIRLVEARLQQDHGVSPGAEEERKGNEREKAKEKAEAEGRAYSSLLLDARQATQRSVKFIRWLRGCLRMRVTAAAALPQLTRLYATI